MANGTSLTNEQIQFIAENYQSMTIRGIAKRLKREYSTVYKYCIRNSFLREKVTEKKIRQPLQHDFENNGLFNVDEYKRFTQTI